MDKRITQQFPKESNRKNAKYLPPKGMLVAQYPEAKAAGCIQAESEELFYNGLMQATKFNPCDGCSVWDRKGPACPCFNQYHTAVRDAKAVVAKEERKQKELHTRHVERCPDCGLRIRGSKEGHESGQQHLQRMKAMSK